MAEHDDGTGHLMATFNGNATAFQGPLRLDLDLSPISAAFPHSVGPIRLERVVGTEIPPEDTTPPVVSNFAPATGPIQKSTPISFDVTDDSGNFARIMVLVEFGDGTYEVIHDGVKFATSYASKSSRKVITDGYRYTVERLGGWTSSSMTIRAIGIDLSGNVG